MPPPPVDLKKVRKVLAEYREMRLRDPKMNSLRAAPLFGIRPSTLREWTRLYDDKRITSDEVEVAPAPDANEPIEELIRRKKLAMSRAMTHEKWSELIPVRIRTDEPIAVALIGDPHIDDDHCDIHQLEHDLDVIASTKGMFAGHIGDLTNNWVGRLKSLYAAQSTRFGDGLRLAQWMLDKCPNLFVVNGNHDMWEKGADLLRFIVKAGVHQNHGARLNLQWPSGRALRLHARHDFPGKSQFSDTHGMKRELLWGHRDHILVAGHTHVDEARVEPSSEAVHWMFRVSGYKVIDEYAKENHFRGKRMAPSVTVVLRPNAAVQAEQVKPFWDTSEAAAYLTWVRGRKTER